MEQERIVLCGANSYHQKYYLNDMFKGLPETIKEELQIMCVLFTEDVGGIITLVFEEDGLLSIETDADEGDYYYDEVSSGLLVNRMRNKKVELFESLTMYYRVVILKEDITEV